MYKKEINELEEDKEKKYINLKKLLSKFSWLKSIIDKPIIDIKLYDNDKFNAVKYIKLKSEFYNVISTW